MMTSHRPNRLIEEKSPYLRQHADNPVDWYPWGDEAFARAKKEDKPVFLSIGYSSCHWCHVMERESFEDAEVARLLNDAFVSVKVDREERPDLDHLYMNVCQALTGSGGWPLTIFLTPEKKPFFAGTYFPKTARFGHLGLMELLPRLAEIWKSGRQGVLRAAENIAQSLDEPSELPAKENLSETLLHEAFQDLEKRFDEESGGFGRAPKFPSPHNLFFLLRYWKRTRRGRALQMAEQTLERMSRGGIVDHLGFGFHRYSTDAHWLLPHFEKMLYDQALLAMAYSEAYQATGKDLYRETAEGILAYVEREMTDEGGGFYSAEDADSESVEGKFYLWTEEEIRRVFPAQQAELAAKVFGVREKGNFQEVGGSPSGQNILYLEKPLPERAADLGIPPGELKTRLEAIKKILLAVRDLRPHPFKDQKILADWNGLMIAAFAKAGQAFERPKYASVAARAADFVLEKMTLPDGSLYHRFIEGEAAVPAFLDDYAFLIWGLIELYETVFDARYLKTALGLCDHALERFWDDGQGGFYFAPVGSPDLVFRIKEAYDGAQPSGNAAMMLNLLRLGRLSGRPGFEEKAAEAGRALSGPISQAPSAHTFWLTALDFALARSLEIVIAGNPGSADTDAMLRALHKNFLPNKVVLFRPADEPDPAIADISPFVKGMSAEEGRATAYVCSNFACRPPTHDPEKMLELLGL